MQTKTSNALHNAIMEAGGKDCPPMLAPSNYVQCKSIIKRYINTNNNELIHYCLQNPPYKFKWTKKTVPVAEAIKRLKQGESMNVQDLETNLYWEFGKITSRDGESLESYYLRFYKMMNELVRNQCDVTNHQELEAHYMYMAQIQEVTLDIADNYRPIIDAEPLQKDDTDKLAQERDFLSSSIEKLKCEIDDSKNHEVTNLQCDYLEALQKCECLEKELSKSKTMSKSFEALQKHAIKLELELQQYKEQINNDKSFKENQLKEFRKEREQYFKIHDLKAQLQDKGVISTTSVSRPRLKRNQLEDRFMPNNSQGKKQQVEDHCRNFKFSNNEMSVTACHDSLNAKNLKVNFVCVTCGKCVLNDNHDMCVIHYMNGVNSRTKQPIVVPISTTEPKRTVNQYVATPLKKSVASSSTNQKPGKTTRKLYEHVGKTCSWWYLKFKPSGYKWKPKSLIGNVNTNVSMPLGNASRNANILEPMTPRCSTMSKTPLSSNSFAARKDYPIHSQLWVIKTHDGKCQASN
nr:hypothetical protein [Tanacetum cinerariifolium]